MDIKQVKTSLFLVWVVLSFVILVILISPLNLNSSTLRSFSSIFRIEEDVTECVFCGMTTAFLYISKGQMADALESNRGSIMLYALFLLNQATIFTFVLRKSIKKGR